MKALDIGPALAVLYGALDDAIEQYISRVRESAPDTSGDLFRDFLRVEQRRVAIRNGIDVLECAHAAAYRAQKRKRKARNATKRKKVRP